VVIADGSVVHANASKNADLFWAIKGAGASFGVITEFEIFTHPTITNIVAYSYTFSGRPFSQFSQRFKDWQTLISNPSLSRNFASQATVSEVGMVIEGTYFGTQAEFEALNLTLLLPDFPAPDVLVFDSWAGILAHWAEDMALEIGGGVPNSFYAKSLVFKQHDLVPDVGIDQFFAFLDSADPGTLLWFGIFDLEGGATNDIAEDATAYAHRDALFYFQPYVSSTLLPLSQTSVNFLDNMASVLSSAVPDVQNNGAYAGYVDPALGQNGQVAYWGTNYPRLQMIKAELDPTDMFHNPQSVRLPGG
jgi:hypothetical protein